MKPSLLQKNLFFMFVVFSLFCTFIIPVQAQNLIQNGDFSDDSGWDIIYFETDQPFYEFNYNADGPKYGDGDCLLIIQMPGRGQLLFWQRITLIAGETYRATGALKCVNYYGGTLGHAGAWYQMYITPELPDETGQKDFDPGNSRFFDINGWQDGFPTEPFDDLWENLNLGGHIDTAPFYTPEGTPGAEVEITFGIKFGQSWPPGTDGGYEIMVDNVGLYLGDLPDTTNVSEKQTTMIPGEYALFHNYPNPFNPSTILSYAIPRKSHVQLTVYDLVGREIAVLVDDIEHAGSHSVKFDAAKLNSGVYLYRLQANGTMITRKMLFEK